VEGATVTAWWTAAGDTATVSRVALSDFRGVFRFCSLPAGAPLKLGAVGAGAGPAVVQVTLAAGVPAQQDLTLPRAERQAAAAAPRGPELDAATVWGRVLSAGSGTPVVGATVRLGAGLPAVTTDRGGRFRIEGVRSGTYDVVVTAPLFGERRARAQVSRGGLDLELRLPARTAGAVALAPVVVTARNLTPVEVMRRTSGTRIDIVSREDLDRAVGMPDVGYVLRAKVPGLKIEPVYYRESSMVNYTRVMYHMDVVAVYLDGRLIDPHDFPHIPPAWIESMEFFPQGYQSYGVKNLQPVLLMHSRH
jgi:hypothetical protein